ncbi:hypothetical protein CsSME_00007502 [Camellia sinensis var. sinensis]
MKVYHQTLDTLIPRFEKLTFIHLVRENNRFADALATLASMIDIPVRVKMCPILIKQRYKPPYEMVVATEEVQDENPWYFDICNFLESSIYPQGVNAKDKRGIQRLAAQFTICRDKLYRRWHLGLHKLCVRRGRRGKAYYGGHPWRRVWSLKDP